MCVCACVCECVCVCMCVCVWVGNYPSREVRFSDKSPGSPSRAYEPGTGSKKISPWGGLHKIGHVTEEGGVGGGGSPISQNVTFCDVGGGVWHKFGQKGRFLGHILSTFLALFLVVF